MDFKAYKEWERKRERNEVPPHDSHGYVIKDNGGVADSQRDRLGNS